jgi:hypothetical protein
MKSSTLIFGAAALLLAPSAALAAPGGNGSTSNGSVNGAGYDHSNGPATTGQPDQDCEALIASGTGSDPGNSASSGHSAFGGSAGDVYAGSQPQNSRNTASVSQYDVACANQPI